MRDQPLRQEGTSSATGKGLEGAGRPKSWTSFVLGSADAAPAALGGATRHCHTQLLLQPPRAGTAADSWLAWGQGRAAGPKVGSRGPRPALLPLHPSGQSGTVLAIPVSRRSFPPAGYTWGLRPSYQPSGSRVSRQRMQKTQFSRNSGLPNWAAEP